MRLCVITFKEIWRGPDGRWLTDGGFPWQMGALMALFAETTLLLVEVAPRSGGIPLPEGARVVTMPRPTGFDTRRKVSVVFRLPQYLRLMASEIRRADVVHTPVPGDLPLLALWLAQLFRRRTITRYCGSWWPTGQTTWMNRVTRQWMRWTAGGRHVMLATGSGDTAPAPGVHWVFATALSASEVADAPVAAERPCGTPPHLVFIGRLEAGKGLDLLLDAVHQLAADREVPAPRLTLIGHGSLRAALDAQARRLGLTVTFTGLLDRPALSACLRDADLCVQPSLSEGFSKAWLDALAHGVPVLSSDVGAARYVVGGEGERGWLVPPGDREALVATLRHALRSCDEWPALRARCRTFARAHTLEAWAESIGAIAATQWGVARRQGRFE